MVRLADALQPFGPLTVTGTDADAEPLLRTVALIVTLPEPLTMDFGLAEAAVTAASIAGAWESLTVTVFEVLLSLPELLSPLRPAVAVKLNVPAVEAVQVKLSVALLPVPRLALVRLWLKPLGPVTVTGMAAAALPLLRTWTLPVTLAPVLTVVGDIVIETTSASTVAGELEFGPYSD